MTRRGSLEGDRPSGPFLSRLLVFLLGLVLGVVVYRAAERLFAGQVGNLIDLDSKIIDYTLLGIGLALVLLKLIASSLRRIPVSVILAIAGLVGLILGVVYVYNLSL